MNIQVLKKDNWNALGETSKNQYPFMTEIQKLASKMWWKQLWWAQARMKEGPGMCKSFSHILLCEVGFINNNFNCIII